MLKKKETEKPFHKVSKDIKELLLSSVEIKDKWDSLTPLAQNEWICYVTIVKKPETRIDHLKRLGADLLNGKRRPCCWPGCPHRNPSAKRWFKKLQD